ncbi:MAG: hypothetical protein GXO85_06680 [Chlorobi bacterium]|nr:hypothetical protein [Chlorobiota bacterium]
MKNFAIIMFFFLTLIGCSSNNPTSDLPIIPQPQKVIFNKGELELLNKNINFVFDDIDAQVLQPLKNEFNRSLSLYNSKLKKLGDGNIVVKIAKLSQNRIKELNLEKKDEQLFIEEGYILKIEPDTIFIFAASETGIFYGFQTFKQLLIAYHCLSGERETSFS